MTKRLKIFDGELWLGDCLEVMKKLPDQSIDMILTDLPYGVTQNKWDCEIDLEDLCKQCHKVLKPTAVLIFTCQQPFTTALINIFSEQYKFYSLVWDKVAKSNFFQAKKRPLRRHEDLLIFYQQQPTYNPQMRKGKYWNKTPAAGSENWGMKIEPTAIENRKRNNIYYPESILQFSNARQHHKIHPTQKPVALFEYLIKTYTNPGDTVLDCAAGSGTTGEACQQTGRNFILIEKEPKYCKVIKDRLNLRSIKVPR